MESDSWRLMYQCSLNEKKSSIFYLIYSSDYWPGNAYEQIWENWRKKNHNNWQIECVFAFK